MDSLLPCEVPAGTDPRLQPFLEAGTAVGADCELARLLELATALITRVVLHRFRQTAFPGVDDAVSEARSRIVARLLRLRSEHAAAPPRPLPPLSDFEAYVCGIAANTCTDLLRLCDPDRAKQLNRLRYLLEKRTTRHGFALWESAGNENLAGFEMWRGKVPETFSEARHLRLLTDPCAAASEAFGAGGWSSLDLPTLVAGLLTWLGGPLKLSALTDAVVRLQTAPTVPMVVPKGDPDRESAELEPVDPCLSPSDELRWKEYLSWLWEQTGRLTAPQRSAFLLHSHCLHELEFAGLISVRQAASALALAAEQMAGLWNILPLERREPTGTLA